MANVLGMLKKTDLISFSQNYAVNRNYVGDRLFGAVKTDNLEAEFYQLQANGNLPTLAQVHALDTEARIGSRPTIEKIEVEKFLIKEKLNQSEKTRLIKNHGVDDSGLTRYVYDDLNNLGNAVVARTEKMKMDLLTSGVITIAENGLNFTVDYGVPSSNKVTYDWGSADHDILADIQTMVNLAKDGGLIPTSIVTSNKIVGYMQKNKSIQAAIHSTLGVGIFTSLADINGLLTRMFGLTIVEDEDQYATLSVTNGVVSRVANRFFAENKFVLVGQVVGKGLWGITPEEEAYGIGWDKAQSMYITFSQWETPDPVALWSKASGIYVPVLANPNGHVIATISFDGSESQLDSLSVTSIAGTASGDTKITVSPALTSGNEYRYKVATDAKLPAYGQDLRTWTAWDGTSDITAATGKEICIAECDPYHKAVKAGIATVTAKA